MVVCSIHLSSRCKESDKEGGAEDGRWKRNWAMRVIAGNGVGTVGGRE